MICFYCIFILTGIVAAVLFLLSGLGEVAHPFQIADDSCHIVDVCGAAHGAFLEISLVDMSAVIADGVGDVECEVVASLFCRHLEQFAVLCL